jgi:hypothetical protein
MNLNRTALASAVKSNARQKGRKPKSMRPAHLTEALWNPTLPPIYPAVQKMGSFVFLVSFPAPSPVKTNHRPPRIDNRLAAANLVRMINVIYPRSPREIMDGWMHLPRYIDKIRLHLAGKLHADYQENLGKGFDGMWLKAAGVAHDKMLETVKGSTTDGEVCDWVRQNVKKSPGEKAAFAKDILSRPLSGDSSACDRLKMRKEQAGIAHRDDITSFVDFIDADEKRL